VLARSDSSSLLPGSQSMDSKTAKPLVLRRYSPISREHVSRKSLYFYSQYIQLTF
jgi:hypothetical protein